MSRLAATLMVFACLLYAAMPAWSAPAMAAGVTTASDMAAAHDHGKHAPSKPMAANHAAGHSDDGSKPCPHGSKGCITPFCAACLTLLPELAFQPLQRFAFSYPAPSPAPAMTPHGPTLADPPPRA